LFAESLHGDQLLALPPFSGSLTAPHPLCYVLVFSSLFIVQVGFFVFILGVAGGILCEAWCSSIGLLNVSQAGLEPSCFLSVMWCREALYGLGVQGVEVLILLVTLLLPIVTPASQQYF
jgi:cytochrome c oxidase subunit IV